MSKQKLDDLKIEIQEKGLMKIKDYFGIDTETLSNMDAEALKHLYNMARLGMSFEREMNLAKRSNEMNFIRISRLVHENKDEIKRYMKASLPQYF